MKTTKLIFIVNGVDCPINTTGRAFLRTARNKALTESNNTGRPFDEWEIHSDQGQALDPTKSISTNGLVDGDLKQIQANVIKKTKK